MMGFSRAGRLVAHQVQSGCGFGAGFLSAALRMSRIWAMSFSSCFRSRGQAEISHIREKSSFFTSLYLIPPFAVVSRQVRFLLLVQEKGEIDKDVALHRILRASTGVASVTIRAILFLSSFPHKRSQWCCHRICSLAAVDSNTRECWIDLASGTTKVSPKCR